MPKVFLKIKYSEIYNTEDFKKILLSRFHCILIL